MGPRAFTGPRGKNGKQGQLKIIVGPNTYASCFQYKVTDFNVYSQDQIFEPGAVAVVEEIHIQKGCLDQETLFESSFAKMNGFSR